MCGIAGMLLRPGQTPDPAILAAMAAALAHRGPDGSGTYISGNAALAHTRLAIIDLATGDQPLFAGQRALIANGEIYNYRELRAAMPAQPFTTGSDCEPPLHLFAANPQTYTQSLRGMYAIAIHDAATATLTLSRDPFGIKPLYIAETAAGTLFASEPQALLASGLIPRAINTIKCNELLNLQFTTGSPTIFTGINRILPGQTITLHNGKPARITNQPAISPAAAPEDEITALAALDRILQNTVELHQRADVPYGMFLSGGIDSAAILAMMARLNPNPVRAYTAGFDIPGVADEREAAAATAAAVGAAHERVTITEAMVWTHLPEIAAAMDDPAADYAIIPTWFLAQRARQEVKVILSGEGGDELFAGYGRYRAAARPFPFARQMRRRGIFEGLNILRPSPASWRTGLAAAETRITHKSALKRAQLLDIEDWLPNDLLLKLDRCLMAHGVEGRTPFVDPAIASFAFSLPDKFLIRNGQGKYLLRRWLHQHLPEARPFAAKQGFDVPIGAWIAGQGARLGPLVAASPLIAELADPTAVKALFLRAREKSAGFAAWVLLFLALWHHRHILNLPPAGDVFSTLAEHR